MVSLVVVAPDVVGSHMAGPGVRAYEIAREMSRHVSVTLATPNVSDLAVSNLRVCTYDRKGVTLRNLAGEHDAILVQGFVFHDFPFLKDIDKPIIVDIYDPFVVENLEVHSCRIMPERERMHARDLAALIEQMGIGDFFICASEDQRDYWLGMLGAAGRINPYNYRSDKSLRKLIDVVPIGLPEEPPQAGERVLKGVHPGISRSDRVLVWGGGLWPWMDPSTIIEAVGQLAPDFEGLRLFFFGKSHPNPRISAALGDEYYAQAMKLSRDRGLYNRHVFFSNQWIAYSERHKYLLEADIGICLHKELVEMHLSSRTRLLDSIWCGLPILCSKGGHMSDIVEQHGLGRVVGCGNVGEVVDALRYMLDVPDLRARLRSNFARAVEGLTWSKAVAPLVEFLKSPTKAPDKLTG